MFLVLVSRSELTKPVFERLLSGFSRFAQSLDTRSSLSHLGEHLAHLLLS
jgi:hypothetical protein